MENLATSKQTLFQFLERPFGLPDKGKSFKYEDRYQKYKKENRIKVEGAVEVDGVWLVHILVPSESTKGNSDYDVVIGFFPPSEKISKQISVKQYYVQFFSNSPGFVYKYATLYKLQGYLIESLYDKLGEQVLGQLPDKANKNYELSYDSSIYYACRYMKDNQITHFGQLNLKIMGGRKSLDKFLRDIRSFEDSILDHDIGKLKKEVKAEIDREGNLSHQAEAKIKKRGGLLGEELGEKKRKKTSGTSTSHKDGVKIIHATRSTLKNIPHNHRPIKQGKVVAKRSTRKS